jgi:hypothetical protein
MEDLMCGRWGCINNIKKGGMVGVCVKRELLEGFLPFNQMF